MEDKTYIDLPECLSIQEQGTWDNGGFEPTGLYEAQDEYGNVYCVTAQETGIERWLKDNGYQDTGDGIHYQRV